MVAHAVVHSVGGALAKRLYDEPEKIELQPWTWLLIIANIVVFMIPFAWIQYTLNTLIPTLTIVEDPNPPAYEPLASTADEETAGTGPKRNIFAAPSVEGKPITSSLRATHFLLGAVGGYRGRFRGIMAVVAYTILFYVITGFVRAFGVPTFAGRLVAALALVQFSTVWVHIIMTKPNALPFYRRLPPMRKAFEATCFPVLIDWVALCAYLYVPELTARLLGLPLWDAQNPGTVPKYHGDDSWKFLIVWLVALAIQFLLVLPAQVALIRVQASLLSPDEETIVPFDFTFQGKVGPAVVDGKGYATLRDALATFSRASWIRLIKMYVKVYIVSIAAFFAVCVGFFLQALMVHLITGK